MTAGTCGCTRSTAPEFGCDVIVGTARTEGPRRSRFWNDFLGCFGIERRGVATFERRATRASTANTGRIDAFWPCVRDAEQKSAGILSKDEERAENQADDDLLGGDIKPNKLALLTDL